MDTKSGESDDDELTRSWAREAWDGVEIRTGILNGKEFGRGMGLGGVGMKEKQVEACL